MAVDGGGGQLVSLITINCGALLLDVNGLLDFTSGHSCSLPSGQAVFTHSSGFVQVQVFFEPDPEGPLGLPDVRVGQSLSQVM